MNKLHYFSGFFLCVVVSRTMILVDDSDLFVVPFILFFVSVIKWYNLLEIDELTKSKFSNESEAKRILEARRISLINTYVILALLGFFSLLVVFVVNRMMEVV